MKNLLLTLVCLMAVAPLSGAGLMPQNVNARLSTAVQSPYDLCFYLEQQQWDQVDAVIKRVPSNYQFDTYKQNTPLMVAIELYAKRVADKPKSFWQTTAGGLVKMVAGSALVVLGMAGIGGRGNDYMDPFKAWMRLANEDLNAPAAPAAQAAANNLPVQQQQNNQQAPQQNNQQALNNQPQARPAVAAGWLPQIENRVVQMIDNNEGQVQQLLNNANQAVPDVRDGVREMREGVRDMRQQINELGPRVGRTFDNVNRTMRVTQIWAARLLGFAALAVGIRFCWQGGQKLKSMLSFHSRSDELEHYKDVILQLLHREDLVLGTQNNDGETALSLVRKHMSESMRDREAYQLFADIEQLILIRGA